MVILQDATNLFMKIILLSSIKTRCEHKSKTKGVFMQRQQRDFVLSVFGHFGEKTEFLVTVKTPLGHVLPERMSFEWR